MIYLMGFLGFSGPSKRPNDIDGSNRRAVFGVEHFGTIKKIETSWTRLELQTEDRNATNQI